MRGLLLIVGCWSFAASCTDAPRVTDRSSLPPFPVAEAKAVLSGRVVFKGDVLPRPRPLPITPARMPASPGSDAAAPEIINPKWEVDPETRGVPHALVEVLGVEDRWRFDAPTEPVVLEQRSNRFFPFVAAALVGQEVVVENLEDVLHNFKWTGRKNGTFNANLPKGERASARFEFPETVHFQCDVQNWMHAWVHVREHALFAVTAPDGSFALPTLPPGTYEVLVRHPNPSWEGERRGVQVREGSPTEITLTIQGRS